MTAWGLFFGWPSGQVWPNLVASVVTFTWGWVWAHRHAMRGVDTLLRDHQDWVKDELDRLRRDMDHSQRE